MRVGLRGGLLAAALLAALMGVLALAGCGKKGPPSPPGPPDQIIYPRSYPVPPKQGVPPET